MVFVMRKYYCKNGEVVTVYPNPNNSKRIIVRYKGRAYDRPVELIGKTLFAEKPVTVQMGSKVILVNLITETFLTVQIVPTKVEAQYRGMGGSYYGAKVVLQSTIDTEVSSEGVTPISKDSPIGKAILGKVEGDVINVRCPDKRIDRYRILKIELVDTN